MNPSHSCSLIYQIGELKIQLVSNFGERRPTQNGGAEGI